ncbi:hypothetical protein ABZ807_27365 [Micromonospora sp. NPDC047548]|uniref:hypothetical protein n=1 Tax=Micromonospora sp. NPDC047548 TaxID=3155624 RepID=UPI0033DCDA1A
MESATHRHNPVDHQPGAEGHRWNPAKQWVVSKEMAHAALVSEEDFVAAQAIRCNPTPEDGHARTFLLSGPPAFRSSASI